MVVLVVSSAGTVVKATDVAVVYEVSVPGTVATDGIVVVVVSTAVLTADPSICEQSAVAFCALITTTILFTALQI